MCNQDVQCRTYDYDSQSLVCHLFESAVETGSVVSSVSLTSRVGAVYFWPKFFIAYGQQCSQCTQNRYLICSSTNNNNTCQCPIHTFWNGIQCENQRYANGYCSNNEQCRTDANLNCTVYNLCSGESIHSSYHWILMRAKYYLSFTLSSIHASSSFVRRIFMQQHDNHNLWSTR